MNAADFLWATIFLDGACVWWAFAVPDDAPRAALFPLWWALIALFRWLDRPREASHAR